MREIIIATAEYEHTMTACPCGSARPFELCCGPVLAGRPADTAETLMRSRYSAYVTGNADYLQKTAAGEALLAYDRDDILQSMRDAEWLGLAVIATGEGGEADDIGTVTFQARFRRNGQVQLLSERSEFRRIGGAWRYCRGTVDVAAAAERIGRNDPCPCGSGQKFKKCHGA